MAEPSPFDNITFPPLDNLPFREGDPEGAIWGFYEHVSNAPAGFKDELGSLNLLTPKRILHAAQTQIRCGKVVSLNWALHKPATASQIGLNGRACLAHRVFRWARAGEMVILDDEIAINTQSGSQWDGFAHWAHYKSGTLRNGIHKFQGKIVGRGILLDYFAFAQSNGIIYSPNEQHLITAAALNACAEKQGVTFEQGDILFIRTGYVSWYENASEEDKAQKFSGPTKAAGVNQGIEEVTWLWNCHFAAVASDSPAFEARPSIHEWNLHDYLLALWGTPIGELFDLEALSRTCKELGRYTFFVTSSPLNIVNGIASPPK
ncbi:putative cyclase-domain-containing protein [Cyathus striatus]|nr:putative cyclase-domain-containing protein [Cyathus striatus]